GILQSAPGRPAAPAVGTSDETYIPQKDANGRFPCPYCTRTYSGARHLNRHLLGHTSNQRYQCATCGKTFTRSDVCKIHLSRCSSHREKGQKLPTGGSDAMGRSMMGSVMSASTRGGSFEQEYNSSEVVNNRGTSNFNPIDDSESGMFDPVRHL
ncbi:hypothetical protein QBC47DRAFT_429757, partial [Echria macrotheca]